MEVKDPSPQTTLLILLGASAWPHSPEFQGSEAFAKAARRVKAYFLNPRPFGLPAENLLDLFDSEKGTDEMDDAIGEFLEQRLVAMKATGNAGRDLLLYFIGHGGFAGDDHEYYLAIRRTRTGNPLASGLRVASLAYTLKEQARHLRRILILDCCFAQQAFSSFQAAPDQVAFRQTIDAFHAGGKTEGIPTKGTTLLGSSNQKSPSLLMSDSSSTMFTKAFLDTLIQGTPSQRDRLTLRDVKEATWDLLSAMRDAPRPVVDSPDQSEGDVADIPFFPNPWIEKERIRQADEEQARREEERIRQVEEKISQKEVRARQVGQNRSKAEEEHAEHVFGLSELRSNTQLFQEPIFLEKAGTHQQGSSSSPPEQSKQTPIQRLPTPNLSSTPTQLSRSRRRFSTIFSTIGIIWAGIGCIMAIAGLVTVSLLLFPAGVANVFSGLMIFFLARIFLARMRKSFLSIIGIFVGAIAILSGIGLIIVVAYFPNAIINEVGSGHGSGGVESSIVTLIAGVIILLSCAYTMVRR